MKKFLWLSFAAAIFILAGCSQDGNVTGPSAQSGKSFLKLPAVSQLSQETEYVVSQSIDGSVGGQVSINENIPGGPYGQVVFNGSLSVPAGAFTGTQNIGITFDDAVTAAYYSPSPYTFDQPLSLTLEYSGLDLSGINPATLDFVYERRDGSFERVSYDRIEVDITSGMLKVINARLPHFSRYGFID